MLSEVAREEVAELISTLHRTEQRLAELTEGEVDAVLDRDGRALLLRRAQEQLRRSEAAKQNAILSALPAHVALLNAKGVIIAVNEAWRSFARSNALPDPGHGVGHNYLEVCDLTQGKEAAEARCVAQGIRSVQDGGAASFSIDYPCHSTVAQRWFRLLVAPLRSDVGGPAIGGAVVMHVDISELKNAEAAMRGSAELLHAVVAGTPDMIFIKDLLGRYRLCNEAAARFAGSTVEQMIGQQGSSLYESATARAMSDGDRRVMEAGIASTYEEVITGVDGTRTVLTTKVPHRNDRGDVIGVIGIARDITDQKRAEIERERERQLLRTLIDALPDVIYTKDAGGRFVVANRATLALFGMQHERELSGKTVFDVVPAELAARVQAADLRVLAGQPVLDRKEWSTDAAGALEWHLTTKMPLRDAGGAISGFVAIKRDITEITRDQEALRRSQALLSISGRLAHVGGWSVELPAAKVVWSDVLAAMHGEPQGFSPTIEKAFAYYPPEHLVGIRAALEGCARDGTPFDVEHEIVTADGRRIWVRAIGEAVRDCRSRLCLRSTDAAWSRALC